MFTEEAISVSSQAPSSNLQRFDAPNGPRVLELTTRFVDCQRHVCRQGASSRLNALQSYVHMRARPPKIIHERVCDTKAGRWTCDRVSTVTMNMKSRQDSKLDDRVIRIFIRVVIRDYDGTAKRL